MHEALRGSERTFASVNDSGAGGSMPLRPDDELPGQPKPSRIGKMLIIGGLGTAAAAGLIISSGHRQRDEIQREKQAATQNFVVQAPRAQPQSPPPRTVVPPRSSAINPTPSPPTVHPFPPRDHRHEHVMPDIRHHGRGSHLAEHGSRWGHGPGSGSYGGGRSGGGRSRH